ILRLHRVLDDMPAIRERHATHVAALGTLMLRVADRAFRPELNLVLPDTREVLSGSPGSPAEDVRVTLPGCIPGIVAPVRSVAVSRDLVMPGRDVLGKRLARRVLHGQELLDAAIGLPAHPDVLVAAYCVAAAQGQTNLSHARRGRPVIRRARNTAG